MPACLPGCGEHFAVVEDPQLDQLVEDLFINFVEPLEVFTTKRFAVVNRPFGDQLQNMVFVEGADDELKSAEIILTMSFGNLDIVSADGSSPTGIIDNCFEAKSGDIVGELLEANFDMFGQGESMIGVEPLALFFTECFGLFLAELFIPSPLAPF